MKIIVFLLLPITAQAQSVGIGYSVKFWGTSQEIINVNVSYNDLSIHYFHSFYNDFLYATIKSERVYVGKQTNTFAISWTPLKYKYIYSGVMVSNKKYPVEKGTHLNFVVGIKIPLNRFSISYKHTSNGFGIQNPINVGADFLSININLY